MNLRTLIQDYLNQTHILQIVTSNNNQPWACTVYFAVDINLNLYWISKPTDRHSTELGNNNKIAGTVVQPHKLGDTLRGIQFQGTAEVLKGDSARSGLKHYVKRFSLSQERVDAIANNKDGHDIYQITPSLFVLFDQQNFPDNPRQEYQIK